MCIEILYRWEIARLLTRDLIVCPPGIQNRVSELQLINYLYICFNSTFLFACLTPSRHPRALLTANKYVLKSTHPHKKKRHEVLIIPNNYWAFCKMRD